MNEIVIYHVVITYYSYYVVPLSCKVVWNSRHTTNSICPDFEILWDFLVAEFNALSRGNVLNFVSSTYFFVIFKFVKKFSYQ